MLIGQPSVGVREVRMGVVWAEYAYTQLCTR